MKGVILIKTDSFCGGGGSGANGFGYRASAQLFCFKNCFALRTNGWGKRKGNCCGLSHSALPVKPQKRSSLRETRYKPFRYFRNGM